MPEVGRAVSEARGLPGSTCWTDADFEMIARRQQRDEDRAARMSGPVLVCDTDALATCIWQERYLGRSTRAVEADRRVTLLRALGAHQPTTSRSCRTGCATASTCAAG